LLASKQKMRVQEMDIKAYVTYSVPLGIMTEADMAKLDDMNTRLQKNQWGTTLNTTAMICEDIDKAGVGLTSLSASYAHLIAKNLILALSGKGTLGFITRSLLHLQDSVIGSALRHSKWKSALKDKAHCHVAKQLTTIRHAGLDLKVPMHRRGLNGSAIVNALNKLRYDPTDLGII